MTARILVVDDIQPNIRWLEARLSAEYFEVMTASNGAQALAICESENCDIVLLDVMMPGMDGFETCRRLKANQATAHIPVVMVTSLDQPADRVRGLEAGADDFLTKPVDDLTLLARVRSLTRLKVVVDELRSRANATAVLGMVQPVPDIAQELLTSAKILLVDDRASSSERISETLAPLYSITLETQPQEALIKAAEGDYDLCVINLSLRDYDALRLCGQLRSLERTRQLPILIIADYEDRARVLRGLDLGVNDFVSRPIDRNELLARVRTQVRRKRYSDTLRDLLQSSIEMAVVDSLTGLNNRRCLENHLKVLLSAAVARGKPMSLMILDLDHFKAINDTYGHDVGDEVLRAFASRVKKVIRAGDLLCRLGGEEFIIVLPDTTLALAQVAAERIRNAVGNASFPIERGARNIPVTVSIGLADRGSDTDSSSLFKRADLALYHSKHNGRNRISAQAA